MTPGRGSRCWDQGRDLEEDGASDRTRTGDIQDHNLALYRLSYARHPRR